jgi:hypothetical protein
MKRDIQAKIYEETKDMSPAELLEYTRIKSEQFREEGNRFRNSIDNDDDET